MAIDRLNDRPAHLGQILRQTRIAAASRAQQTSRSSGGSEKSRKIDRKALKRMMAEKLKALSASTGSDQKLQRVFIEIVLIWEFGEAILMDPGLNLIIDEMAQAIEHHPRLNQQMNLLISQLTASG